MDLYKEYWCRRFALHAVKLTALSRDELYDYALAIHPNASMLSPEQIAEFALEQLALRARHVVTLAKRHIQPFNVLGEGVQSPNTAERRLVGLRRIPAVIHGPMTYVAQSGRCEEIPRGKCSLTFVGDVVVVRWGEQPDCAASFNSHEVQATCAAGMLDRRGRAR